MKFSEIIAQLRARQLDAIHIVVVKPVKAGGAKGNTFHAVPLLKHLGHRRPATSEKCRHCPEGWNEEPVAGKPCGGVCEGGERLWGHGYDIVTLSKKTGSNGEYKRSSKALLPTST